MTFLLDHPGQLDPVAQRGQNPAMTLDDFDFDQALRLNPGYTRATISRGNALLAKGDLERAITSFDQALRVDPREHGDGGVDLTPLTGLSKRQGAALLRHLDAPESTWRKVPTADLESDKPLIADEVALGVRYEVVDDYLEGEEVSPEDETTILGWYHRTAHKRALPVTPDHYLHDR